MERRASTAAGGLAYQPALDGLRAVAVIAVLLFHGGVAWAQGGYLGVSLFFTLSGFLITSLLLDEYASTGTISIRRFVSRRARRLLPASVLCLVALTVCWRAGLLEGQVNLRRDLLGSLLQVNNWVQLFTGGSYADLLNDRAGVASPVEHFWSLAVEEQFYWVWPWVMCGVLWMLSRRCVRRGWRDAPRRAAASAVWPLAVLAMVFSLAAPVTARLWGPDAVYWATPGRLGEILIGGVLAALVRRYGLPTWVRHLAWPAMCGFLALCIITPAGHGFAYMGGLPLIALVSAAVIAGIQPAGAVREALSTPPLVAIGKISYGLYVYHWPVYVIVDAVRTGLDGPALFGLRVGVTTVIAAGSYVLVERPIRLGAFPPRRTFASALTATAVAAVGIAVLVPAGGADYWNPTGAQGGEAGAPVTFVVSTAAPATPAVTSDTGRPTAGAATSVNDATGASTVAGGPTATSNPDPPAMAIAVAAALQRSSETVPPSVRRGTDADPNGPPGASGGAATTLQAGTPEAQGSTDRPSPAPEPSTAVVPPTTMQPSPTTEATEGPLRVLLVGDSTALALSNGLTQWAGEQAGTVEVGVLAGYSCGFFIEGQLVTDAYGLIDPCSSVSTQLADVISSFDPDVVIVYVSGADGGVRTFDGGATVLQFTDFAPRVADAYRSAFEVMMNGGRSSVVWLDPPPTNYLWQGTDEVFTNGERDSIGGIVAQIADEHPASVTIAPFRNWFTNMGYADERGLRPDGIHYTPEAAYAIVDQWLGPLILATASGAP